MGNFSRPLRRAPLLLFALSLSTPALAQEWDDFYNNLATDITPLLALFGEQVTKQFLSESTSIWDNIIFALVPLGIITAVVSVIRVCGSSTLKALIGRSQEGHGVAEAELCSSTSLDVCELWSRGGIVRIFGRPKIIEFIHDELKEPDCFYPRADGRRTAGLHRPDEYFRANIQVEGSDTAPDFAPSPNLSLNIGIKRTRPFVLLSAAAIGFGLQLGLLAFAVWTTYVKKIPLGEEGELVSSWAFPLFLVGTVLLDLGMFLCAFLIEKSTGERFLKLDNKKVYWLQPCNQTLGDQTFDAFAYSAILQEYATSWKMDDSYRAKRGNAVWFTILATIVGFTLQFIGLRALHPFVALFQLGATMVMAGVRVGLRARRLKDDANQLTKSLDAANYSRLEGHELDWQAFEIESKNGAKSKWEITSVDAPDPVAGKGELDNLMTESVIREGNIFGILSNHKMQDFESGGKKADISTSELEDSGDSSIESAENTEAPLIEMEDFSSITEAKAMKCAMGWIKQLQCEDALSKSSFSEADKGLKSTSVKRPNIAARTLYYRARLAELSSDDTLSESQKWESSVRDMARQLGYAMQEATREIMSGDMQLKKGWNEAHVLFWKMNCRVRNKEDGLDENLPFYLLMQLRDNLWHINRSELEAILGLWTWSLRTSKRLRGGRASMHKAFAKCNSADDIQRAKADLHMWVSRSLSLSAHKVCKKGRCASDLQQSSIQKFSPPLLSVPLIEDVQNADARCRCSQSVLTVPTRHDLLKMCALDIFTSFLDNILKVVSELSDSGPAIGHHNESFYTGLEKNLRFTNRHIQRLTEAFLAGNLGSDEDALLCIIPVIRSQTHLQLPIMKDMNAGMLSLARENQKKDKFIESEALLRWLYFNTEGLEGSIEVATEMGEVYRRAMRSTRVEIFEFGLRGICWMLENINGHESIQRIVHNYGWVALKMATDTKWSEYRTKISQKVDEDMVPGFEKMQLEDAIELQDIYPVSLIVTYRWKPSPNYMIKAPAEPHLKVTYGNSHSNYRPASANNSDYDVADYGSVSLANGSDGASDFGSVSLNSFSIMRRRPKSLSSIIRVGEDDGDTFSRPLLSFAAEKNCLELAEDLLEMGADPNCKDSLGGRTPIFYAAKAGNSKMVRRLVDVGASVTSTDNFGYSPLSVAAQYGRSEVARLLLESDVNIEEKNDTGQTPLLLAAASGLAEVVSLLLERGANTGAKDNGGETPLIRAAKEPGFEETVRLLLEKGANMEVTADAHKTPLLLAAQTGSEKSVRLLLENGANVEAKSAASRTALSYAAERGSEDMIRTLIERGADIDAKDLDGQTPLIWATRGLSLDAAKLLIEMGADIGAKDNIEQTALFWASRDRSGQITKVLIEKGADVNGREVSGRTPLFMAATTGSKESAKLLIENGADIDARDNEGQTPLFLAVMCNFIDVVELLLESGVDIEARDRIGRTALSVAAVSGSKTIAQLLIEKGANVRTKDNDGVTPWSLAARMNAKEIVEMLLEMGVDMEIREETTGYTPLCMAAWNGSVEVVKLLLEKGADIEAKTAEGETPLLLAAEARERPTEVLELLLKAGADIEAKDARGCTALARAVKSAPADVVELLVRSGASLDAKLENGQSVRSFSAHWGAMLP